MSKKNECPFLSNSPIIDKETKISNTFYKSLSPDSETKNITDEHRSKNLQHNCEKLD